MQKTFHNGNCVENSSKISQPADTSQSSNRAQTFCNYTIYKQLINSEMLVI